MNPTQNTARIAGFLILFIAICAPFSMLYIPSTLIVPGNAATTVSNIRANEGLFRVSLVGDSLTFLAEIVLVAFLYVLLKPVSKTLSLTAAYARLAMTVIQGVNLLNHVFVLLLLSGAIYLKTFEGDQLNALTMLFINAHKYTVYVWEIFFGFHLIVLGYLVFKSGYFPKVIGVLLLLAAPGYLLESYSNLLFPANEVLPTVYGIFLGLSAIGELAFALWLVVKGVDSSKIQPVVAVPQTLPATITA